jgi:hypothetical protein
LAGVKAAPTRRLKNAFFVAVQIQYPSSFVNKKQRWRLSLSAAVS